jgi:hypothetical protein
MNKIVLMCLWFGNVPEYFKYHYETAISNSNVDFLFITDQDIVFDRKNKNYNFLKIDINILTKLIKDKIGIDYLFTNNRNICQLKCALGDIFRDEIIGYDYFGIYDIDTLLGDFNKFIIPYIYDYDIISFGVREYHDRVSGPLMIIRNIEKYVKLYRNKLTDFVYKLYNYDIDSFDETEFNSIIINDNSIRFKILYDVCNFSVEKCYPQYESYWSGGKLYINDQEKLLNHFIDKDNISFYKIGNTITSFYKKHLIEDFYWVTYFSENYEKIGLVLLESIYKFSCRKCIVYTVNYTSMSSYQKNEQFIFRRIDIDIDTNNHENKFILINNYKPNILLDSLNYMANSNFIYIDADSYINVNADNLRNYIKYITNYPLYNSHVHDWLLANDVTPDREWINPLQILSDVCKINIVIFPRRKANLMIFNINCKWFFEEQIQVYTEHKNKTIGIFRLQDEDCGNLLLSKYNLHECLPVLDMEESSNIDMEKFYNYSYNMTEMSSLIKLPKSKNEVYFFHGFKNERFIDNINMNHLPTVIENDRFILSYINNTILFKRNSFFNDKKISLPVRFNVYNMKNEIVLYLDDQLLYNYWLFYIGNCYLHEEYYNISIEDNLNNIIFNKIIKIT